MAGRKIATKNKMIKLMSLRLTEGEAKVVKKLAKAADVKVSVYLRNLLLETIGALVNK